MPYAMPQTDATIVDDPAFRSFMVKARRDASKIINDDLHYDEGSRSSYYDEKSRWLYRDTQHGVNPLFGCELYSEFTNGKFVPFARLAYDEAATGSDQQIGWMFAFQKKMSLMGSSENPFRALRGGPDYYEEDGKDGMIYRSDARMIAGCPGRLIGSAEIVLKQWDPNVYYHLNFLFCCLR